MPLQMIPNSLTYVVDVILASKGNANNLVKDTNSLRMCLSWSSRQKVKKKMNESKGQKLYMIMSYVHFVDDNWTAVYRKTLYCKNIVL